MLSIHNPCSKILDFNAKSSSAYCDHCELKVIDFSSYSEIEIKQYFELKRSESVCGRILKPLSESHTEFISNVLNKIYNSKKLSFKLLYIIAFALVGCSESKVKNANTNGNQLISKVIKSDAIVVEESSYISEKNELKKSKLSKVIKSDPSAVQVSGLLFKKRYLPKSNLLNGNMLETVEIVSYNPNLYITGDLTISGGTYSGESVKKIKRNSVKEMPEFPGGESEMIKFIQNNLRVNYTLWIKPSDSLIFFVDFIVNKKGKVRSVKIKNGINRTLDSAAKKLIKSMPDFKPGRQNGKPVNMKLTFPINYSFGKQME